MSGSDQVRRPAGRRGLVASLAGTAGEHRPSWRIGAIAAAALIVVPGATGAAEAASGGSPVGAVPAQVRYGYSAEAACPCGAGGSADAWTGVRLDGDEVAAAANENCARLTVALTSVAEVRLRLLLSRRQPCESPPFPPPGNPPASPPPPSPPPSSPPSVSLPVPGPPGAANPLVPPTAPRPRAASPRPPRGTPADDRPPSRGPVIVRRAAPPAAGTGGGPSPVTLMLLISAPAVLAAAALRSRSSRGRGRS